MRRMPRRCTGANRWRTRTMTHNAPNTPSPDWDKFDLTCDHCGAKLQVTVRRASGRDRMESYDCPACRNLFFCLGADTPLVHLLTSSTVNLAGATRC